MVLLRMKLMSHLNLELYASTKVKVVLQIKGVRVYACVCVSITTDLWASSANDDLLF